MMQFSKQFLLLAAIACIVAGCATPDDDGVSRGFSMKDFKPRLQNVYQIIAYPRDSFSGAQYPAVRATIPADPVAPFTELPNDYGYLWVGATLNNGFFIQTGLSTSHQVDANGNMEWHVFWQVWNGTEFLYSFDDKLSNYSDKVKNIFALVCTDPELGEWEFRINDRAIGRANTESCAMNIANSSLTFEVVSDSMTGDVTFFDEQGNEVKQSLPQLGPVVLGEMEFWDDKTWNAVPKAVISYGIGGTDRGTQVDAKAVCSAYGASPLDAQHFVVGSNLTCAPISSLIWTDIAL